MTQRPRIPGEGIAVHFRADDATTCHACARVRAGSAQALAQALDDDDGAEVGACEVDAWNLDDLDAGEALACDACGVVLYRAPDALDALACEREYARRVRVVAARVVELDAGARRWQVRDSVDRAGYLLAVVIDGDDLPSRYVRPDVHADDLLDVLRADLDDLDGLAYLLAPADA